MRSRTIANVLLFLFQQGKEVLAPKTAASGSEGVQRERLAHDFTE